MSVIHRIRPLITGHVLIRDRATREVLVDKMNAVHFANMAEAMAQSLGNRTRGHVHGMVFGNGGSVVNGVGAITYFPPNVQGGEAQLYNETYRKIVDDLSPRNLDTERNFMRVDHGQGLTYADIAVTCVLDYSEPAGQDTFDDAVSTEGAYSFDEIGLKAFDPDSPDGFGKLLTHCVFSPVQKALNRSFEIVYTLRVVLA